jgi:hypothetical protein
VVTAEQMSMSIEAPFFLLGLSLLLVHELDAVRCHEWRMFPGLSALPDRWGLRLFILFHVPLLFLLLGAVAAGPGATLVAAFDLFFILHLGLHLLFLRHPQNEFRDALSWTLILGAALSGGIDLLLWAA